MTLTRVHGVVHGLVQGVSYRWAMQRQAAQLGVRGWVRNLPDGRVEFEAEGTPFAVGVLVEWAQSGPAYARVDRVETTAVAPRGDQEFRVTF